MTKLGIYRAIHAATPKNDEGPASTAEPPKDCLKDNN